jgi:hypothetical protein
MDLNEINEKQDGIFIFVSIVGIVLFIALLMKAFEKRKEGDGAAMLTALFFAFLALLIAIGANYAIDDPSKRLVKFNLDFNSDEFKEAVVCYWKYAGVVVIFTAFYFIGRLIYLYKLSKNSYKVFSYYNSIIEEYNAEKKPIENHKVKIFKVDSKLINPLDPKLWSKNVAYCFAESEIDNGF